MAGLSLRQWPITVHPRRSGRADLQERPLLDIHNLSTECASRNGVVTAVDGVDLTIRRGEILALVGESGSGKTMTALSVMRLLPPQAAITGGSVSLDGIDLLGLSESAMNGIRGARIALLFQQPRSALDPTCRIGTQVAEAMRRHYGTPRHKALDRSVELLADVGIPEPRRRAQSYAHQMSGGMAQRAMIAAALSGEPELLIADEPTTSLDVTVQAQILKLLLSKCEQRGLSILLITHDLGIVASIADRVAVMYAGRIVEQAPTAQIFARPTHPYTQALMRSSLLEPDEHGQLFTIPVGSSPQALRGCRFCSRCSLTDKLGIRDVCVSSEPGLVSCGENHVARCWGAVTQQSMQ